MLLPDPSIDADIEDFLKYKMYNYDFVWTNSNHVVNASRIVFLCNIYMRHVSKTFDITYMIFGKYTIFLNNFLGSFSLTATFKQLAISSTDWPIYLSLLLSVVLKQGGMLSIVKRLDTFLSLYHFVSYLKAKQNDCMKIKE